MDRYPAVSLDLDLSPRRVDLVAENFDIAIRMGDLPEDSTLAARRVAIQQFGLYAAPSYLARRGLPEQPDDLLQHDLLCILSRSGGAVPWVLQRGKVRWEKELTARLTANSPQLLAKIACSGAGIAASTDFIVAKYVRKGELVRVLPDWDLPGSTGWAVFPGRRLMPAKTRAFLDMLEEVFCKDREKAN
jgi:DNA-binding transcriptional LysR family regulator